MIDRYEPRLYRSAIQQISDRYHQLVRNAWHIADDEARADTVRNAHRAAVADLERLRARHDEHADAERARLVRRAFTPWYGEPADRSVFDRQLADLERTVQTEADAYRALSDAQGRAHVDRHALLAVYRVAWDRGWRDIVELGRSTAETRYLNEIDELLAFEREVLPAAAFDLAAADVVGMSA